MKAIRLLIVDDHEVVRVGLRSVLENTPGLEVVGAAATGAEALESVAARLPDVVLLDLRLPDMSGVRVCQAMRSRYPRTRVVVFTSYSDEEALISSLLAGASGYVLKGVGCRELVQGIRLVAEGGSWLDPGLTDTVLRRLRGGAARSNDLDDIVLTQRERDILSLIAQGQTNKEIAKALGLSQKTVRNYVSSLLAKLKVSNRAEAAAHAVRENLVG
ncbi:MAG: response regulator [Limnochordia bacterium]|jgi:two-component system response regulator DevR